MKIPTHSILTPKNKRLFKNRGSANLEEKYPMKDPKDPNSNNSANTTRDENKPTDKLEEEALLDP